MFLKKSIEAYIGCISGAIMRGKYIEVMKEAGFHDVGIIDETSFPIECMANDPTATALIENLKIPLEKVNEVTSSIRSIKVRDSNQKNR